MTIRGRSPGSDLFLRRSKARPPPRSSTRADVDIDKYVKAKRYCDAPFEVRRHRSRDVLVPIDGEWIGEQLNGGRRRKIAIHCADATAAKLKAKSLDAVFTDPPYFGNVQYGDLMDFCYLWLRRLVGSDVEGFDRKSTRTTGELTGNTTQARGLDHFTEGLAKVYRRMAEALKPGASLVFTYHHNKLEAYQAIGVAILDAGTDWKGGVPSLRAVRLQSLSKPQGRDPARSGHSRIPSKAAICRDSPTLATG